ncbi:hypothetical protein [Shewanella algidipiscicola]|uniref:hypothetical protein n=1 Tax=Shewanella algidipiscicola TaxID=614070 RepID=UPI000D784DDA|nr:hypothetical protein [Shewanella algidipiscicola]
MKSRELKTIHDVIVSDYTIEDMGDGKFLHHFKPKTTNTRYQFIANGTPEVEEGERYNIGYYNDADGNNIIELSCMSKNNEVNPMLSYLYSKQYSKERHVSNKAKNDQRVSHTATDGYYWGKKYAWREFGLAIAQDAFHAYLKDIKHPQVDCTTTNPDLPYTTNDASIAYKEEGLATAIEALIASAVKVTKVHYESPLYSKRFTIRGISAVTDKK